MLNAADILTILQIMSDARVSAFFEQDDIVRMIMSGDQPAKADVEGLVQNEPLNCIVQSESLMKKIMDIQDKLSSQFEEREQERKTQLARVLVELGFEQHAVDTAMASQRDGPGHLIGVLAALRPATTSSVLPVTDTTDSADALVTD